ncbi:MULTISPECIES: DUF2946 family protein [Methylorubrum]|uniref:DUF2946 family protein n=1 Tax=Methylobacteriaceae TaxID=119045 RepID=UPI000CDB9C74|nr:MULTISPECIES: DUF2946 family protein [Methylorubrum]MCP1549408.1 hypothetical protein [Methylorubrum zatmanii]MCP1553979.1 hypothetical protein [Methylorubrum extorquens]MCP1579710.1 hypothetical protein [Methylorubrum extorquens]POR41058.1 hypothetical protein CRT23_20725 [Methylobacterium sp. V23]
MTLTRQTWRCLAAILMIVAFVMPSVVHAHVGHTHGPTLVAAVDDGQTAVSEGSQVGHDHAGDTNKSKAHAACCAACACHGGLTVTEAAAVGRVWRSLRLALGPADLAPPSRAPEALPEPPRSFA